MTSTTTEEEPGGGPPSKTWTCDVCSLVNGEPDAKSLLMAGGIVSCELCLKVRGQGDACRQEWRGLDERTHRILLT